MNRRVILLGGFVIILIVLGFAAFLISSRRKQETTQTTTSEQTTTPSVTAQDLSNLPPAQFDASIKENLAQATSFAKKWRSDAKLVYFQVKLTSLIPNEGTEIFAFDSPSVSDSHFTFTISQKSKRYIRAIIPEEDYLGNLSAIDQSFWKYNYVSALQTAETAGGKEFRDKNSTWTIEINLSRGEPNNWLWYVIDYKSETGDSFSIKINPETGEINKETGGGQ